jgi:pimeloyl-ACP methyl ester carboxylesterase
MRLLVLTMSVLAACGPGPLDPLVIETTTSGLTIRREVLVVAGPTPPENPLTHGATPAEASGMQVVRYRLDTGTSPPLPARAIVVLLPGFLGGAGSFDSLARAVVRRSTRAEPLEAWAVDRRANLLEDRAGLEAAIAAREPNLVTGYYFEGQAVGGKTFEGFKQQAQLDFESEWGVAQTIADLRAVMSVVPAEHRRARMLLAGHSLGASLAAQYAAWDFEGVAGHDELAGLVLIDGVTGQEGDALTITQAQYETTGVPSAMGTQPSLNELRAPGGTRYVALPLLEASLFPIGVGTALRATTRPDLVEADQPRNQALATLFFMDRLPKFTNRAAFGLAFDAASCPVTIAAVNAGASAGGALTPSTSVFGSGTVVRPTELTATYTWVEFDQLMPHEVTSLDDFALAWARPGADFGEWYFPARLSLDAALGASLTLEPTSWPVSHYGVRAVHGRELSLPVLVEAAGVLNGQVARYAKLKALLPPVGEGRPQDGTSREGEGFLTVSNPGFSHLDPLAATDAPGSEAAQWFDTLARFMRTSTPAGGWQVELR